jgi:hypothetical protein
LAEAPGWGCGQSEESVDDLGEGAVTLPDEVAGGIAADGARVVGAAQAELVNPARVPALQGSELDEIAAVERGEE